MDINYYCTFEEGVITLGRHVDTIKRTLLAKCIMNGENTNNYDYY